MKVAYSVAAVFQIQVLICFHSNTPVTALCDAIYHTSTCMMKKESVEIRNLLFHLLLNYSIHVLKCLLACRVIM